MNGFRAHQNRVKEEARLAHFIETAKTREIEVANRQLQERNAKINRRHRLLSLLPTVDYQAKHQRLLRLRQTGTNQWIQTNPLFKSWIASPKSDCLCCYGIPGSGKSVLAASVVEHLTTLNLSRSSALCYYYCDYADALSLQPTNIIGSLIKQLLIQLPLATFDENFSESLEESTSTTLLTDSSKSISRLLTYYTSAYIVLEGLDELSLEGQTICLELIKSMLQKHELAVRFYVTSRSEERTIRSALKTFKTIELSNASIDEDIALFIEAAIDSGFLEQNPAARRPRIKQEIVRALIDGAQGM